MEQKEWFNIKDTQERGYYCNMVISERSIGKTYSSTYHFVKLALESDFNGTHGYVLWLRRGVKAAEQTQKAGFMSGVGHLFPDYEFKERKGEVLVRKAGTEDDFQLIVLIESIKHFDDIKGFQASEGCKFVVFDEFLPEDDQYFNRGDLSEPTFFFNIVDSVTRGRQGVQIFLLANAIKLFNPYFDYFNVFPNLTTEVTKFKDIGLLIQVAPIGKYRKTVASNGDNPLKKLLRGTEYERRSMTVDFQDNDYTFVERKSKRAICMGVFKFGLHEIGVWVDVETGYVYYSQKQNPTVKTKINFSDIGKEDFASKYNIRNSKLFDYIIQARLNNTIRFESPRVKSIVQDKLKNTIFL